MEVGACEGLGGFWVTAAEMRPICELYRLEVKLRRRFVRKQVNCENDHVTVVISCTQMFSS